MKTIDVDRNSLKQRGGLTVRPVQSDDVAAILEIYRPYVENSAISFEDPCPSEAELKSRIAHTTARYPWFVAEIADRLVGYAYATQYRARAAYQWSVETSVYLHSDFAGLGIAHTLYEQLMLELRRRGFLVAYAVVSLPNDASVEFHERFGFAKLATFPRAGFKNGAWHDAGWWRYDIAPAFTPPDPLTIPDVT